MAKYRIVLVTKGDYMWYEAEYRTWGFFWNSCFTHCDGDSEYREPVEYSILEKAQDAIERHRKMNAKPTKKVVVYL